MSINLPEERTEKLKGLFHGLPADVGINKQSLLSNLERATWDETHVLDDLFSIIDAAAPKTLSEIFRGAHVVIYDARENYLQWHNLKSASERPSSHYSYDEQYEVAGPLCHTILFGTIGGHTWLQMENHSYDASMIKHGIDYVKYKKSGRNQGPYGSSAYTDKNPLWIKSTTDP